MTGYGSIPILDAEPQCGAILLNMPDDKVQYMSADKLDALKQELAGLRQRKIPELAKRIDDARQLGDLSENAEYHAAREEMSWAQSHVKKIEYILERAEVISRGAGANAVSVGSQITVKVNGLTREFTIVGAQEADPMHGKISNESPLGSALLGKRKGEKVNVTVPAGVQVYEILDTK